MRALVFIIAITVAVFANVAKMSAVKGEVSIVRGDNTILAKSGTPILEKDIIKTKKRSKAQLIFKDETVITVGRNSEFKVEEYKFDGAKSKTTLKASRGFFKAITGKIGKVAPNKFKIKTKTATIGIRGTHFLGNITDDSEAIACTKGAISVEAQGVLIDVLAGEMTRFNVGEIPSTPVKFNQRDLNNLKGSFGVDAKLAKKISSVKLNKNSLKPDTEKLKEVLKDINNIKDNDKKIAALDMLEDSLNSQIDEILGENNIKVSLPTYSSSSYKSIEGGYFLENALELDGDKYIVNGLSFDTLDDALLEARLIELWREGTESSADLVANKMNFDATSQSFPKHWNANTGTKTVAIYEGSSIGYVTDQVDKSQAFIERDETNSAKIVIDFGSRFLFGDIGFNSNNKDGSKDLWRVMFGSIGQKNVTPTSFYSTDLFQGAGANTNLVDADIFFNRYYGDDIEQLSGYFEFISNRVDPNDYSQDEVANGLYVVNKTDELTLKPIETGSSDYFSWGYWSTSSDLKLNETLGGFIKPNLDETKAEIISGLATNGLKATYSGEVAGTVHYANTGDTASLIENGKINMSVDFAKYSATGDMSFNTVNENWSVNINEATIENSGFSFTDVTGSLSDGDTIYGFEGDGQFYGESAEALGGGFGLTTNSGKVAIGAFGANR